jgi:tetratricopeptide (TPR) repeat protein
VSRPPLGSAVVAWALAGLVAGAAVVFHPAYSGDFVSDDLNAIVGNELVTEGASAAQIFSRYSWWGSARGDAPGYRPLATWSFALNYRLAGTDVRSWHAINFVLHGLVSWLVMLAALELGYRRSTALWCGVIFCVLTIHTEAVAWVVGRADLMAAVGYCGTLVFLLRHRRLGRGRDALLAAAFLLLGMLAKESAATVLAAAPLAALCLPGGKEAKRRDLWATGFLLVAFGAYAVFRLRAGGPFLSSGAGDLLDNPLAVLEPVTRWLGALAVLGRYLALTVWPHPLSVDYSFDALAIGPGFVADRYSAIALAAGSVLALTAKRGGAVAVFSLLLAASAYSLVSNTVMPIGTVMAERLFYLPTVGLILLAAAPIESALALKRRTAAATLVLGAVTAAYAAASMARAHDWQDAIRLFESAARAHPRSARAHMELASAYGHAGRATDAETAFARALEILPTYAAAWYNLGNARARRGALDAAAEAYRRAVEHKPRLVQAWYNLGLVEQMRGDSRAALEAFGTATRVAPRDAQAHASLAEALVAAGRLEEAVASYSRAVELVGAADTALRLHRGAALERLRGCEAALPDYLAAAEGGGLAEQPGLERASACLVSLGRSEQARLLRERVRNRQIANPRPGR